MPASDPLVDLRAHLDGDYRLNDPVVLAAVNEIEMLAGGLSNKIWQKITLLGHRSGNQ